MNEEIVEIFGDFARLCFKKFGDRVKRWTTLNEPWISGMMAYYYANFAPCIEEPLEAPYTYVHHQLMAHSQAFRIYEKEFKEKQGGVIGISLDTSHYMPDDKDSADDKEATNRAFMFRVGIQENVLMYLFNCIFISNAIKLIVGVDVGSLILRKIS